MKRPFTLLLLGMLVIAPGPTVLADGIAGPGFTLGDGRTARLEKLETLPFVDDEYTRRFRFDAFENPKLRELRTKYDLDAVIAAGRDEFERQVLLLDWVHRRFRLFGRPSSPARGAVEVLEAIDQGHRFFCAQYAEVFVSAAASLGWVDRPLALRRHRGVAKVGGSTEHSVTEIWSNQYAKWVMLDPTSNLHLLKDGIPLNAYEIRREWFERDGTNLVFVIGAARRHYRKADLPVVLGRFPEFGELALHPDELDKYGFIGFIPNTDLMDSGYDYGGMFIVKDRLCDGTRWHERTVPQRPESEPYFPVGQASLELRTDGGTVRVTLRTLTPNFDRFETRLDGASWNRSADRFEWTVHPGSNRLEARVVNRFGIAGPVSEAVVRVSP